jgi:hypothetical protein
MAKFDLLAHSFNLTLCTEKGGQLMVVCVRIAQRNQLSTFDQRG